MTFAAPAEAYDRYMGRWSRRLAPLLADFAGVERGMRVLDVGCGPGSLTEHLVERVGSRQVHAVDPSEQFAQACAARVPAIEVGVASAERLPWADGVFDVVLSQLVVNFLDAPVEGVREMARVTRYGVVAACVWDYEEMGMLRPFWDAALALDPEAPAEHLVMRFGKPAELRALWLEAGLEEVETDVLEVEQEYGDFDDWWDPFTAGVGPGGRYCAALEPAAREALREECRRRIGGSLRMRASASAVRGVSRRATRSRPAQIRRARPSPPG
jgi:ubiquinone/menaquinone biosynthesis C-methylase UbiE